MKRFLACIAVLVLMMAGSAIAQDTISRIGASATFREQTEVVSTDKIFVYAKQVARGSVGGASGESVESALNRLFALVGDRSVEVTIQYSADGALWHSTYVPDQDSYFRFRVGTGTVSGNIPLGGDSPNALVAKLQSLQGASRLNYSAIRGTPTGHDIVHLLSGLQGGDRLSYNVLNDVPAALTAVGIVRMLEQLTGGDRLDYSALSNPPTGHDIVALLEGLIGGDRLHYSALDGAPPVLTASGIVALLRGLPGADRLPYSAIDGTPTLTPTFEYSADGQSGWHSQYSASTDRFRRMQIGNSAWSDADPIGNTTVTYQGGAQFAAGTGINITDASGTSQISLAPNAAVAWQYIRNRPESADRFARANEVIGLDAHIQQYLEGFGLTGPQPPFAQRVIRQYPRRNERYSLDVKPYLSEYSNLSVNDSNGDSTLPPGLAFADGVISGTPSTEGTYFVQVTASNTDGDTKLIIPMIVLRDSRFFLDPGTTGNFQGFQGLTVKGTNLAALYAPNNLATRVYFFNKHGTPQSGTFTFSHGTNHIPTNATGLARDATRNEWALLSPNNGSPAVLRYTDAGALPTANQRFSSSALGGARGLVVAGNTLYVANGTDSTTPRLIAAWTSRYTSATGGNLTGVGDFVPQGLGIVGTEFYVLADANATANPPTAPRVFVFSTSKELDQQGDPTNNYARAASQEYRDFSLNALNSEPRGMTFLDGYWYVIQAEGGNLDDRVYLYPSKEIYDPSVPEVVRIEIISQGPYTTGDAILIRVTFSGAVDISSSAQLRLKLGEDSREAISVNGRSGTTAAAQTNTSVAFFRYVVQATDVDDNGIQGYDFPFLPVGTILPAGSSISEHSLVADTSAYRAVMPPGLAGLHPTRPHNVNSVPQANLAETDPHDPSFVKGQFPDSASLGQFKWTAEVDVPIEYAKNHASVEPSSYTTAILQGLDWSETVDVVSGDLLLVRISEMISDDVRARAYMRDDGDSTGRSMLYEKTLSHLETDTAAWHKFQTSPIGGYRYYAFNTRATKSFSVGTAYRELPWASIGDKPELLTPVNPDWDATSGLAEILNKPDIELYQTGEDDSVANIVRTRSQRVTITPSQRIRNAAIAHGTKPHLSIAVHWKTADTPSAPAVAQGRISVEAEPARAGDYEGQFDTLPRGTTYFVSKASVTMEPADTSYLVDLERDGEDPDPSPDIIVEKVVWRIDLADAAPLSAGTGIDITNGAINIADDGVTNTQLADDAVKQDNIDFESPPRQGQTVFVESAGQFGGRYGFVPEQPVSHVGLKMATDTGSKNLSQVSGLSYTADIEATGSARSGHIIYVEVADGTGTSGYVVVVGEPAKSSEGQVTHRFPIDEMAEVGSANAKTYYKSSAITIPANAEVDFFLMSPYAAEQVKDLYAFGGGSAGGGGITDVTATPPLVVSGTDAKNINLPDDSLEPDKLESDTETEKQAFRNRIGTAPVHNFTIPDFNVQSGTGFREWQWAISQQMINEAGGRPFEVSLTGILEPSQPGANSKTKVTIQDRAGASGTTGLKVWAEIPEVDAAPGNRIPFKMSAMLPPTERTVYIRFSRNDGAQSWEGRDMTARITTGTLATDVYVNSTGFDGNLGTDDDTVQEVAQKVDDLSAGAPQLLTWTPAKQPGGGTAAIAVVFSHSKSWRLGPVVYVHTVATLTVTGRSIPHGNFIVNAPTSDIYDFGAATAYIRTLTAIPQDGDLTNWSVQRRNASQWTLQSSGNSVNTNEKIEISGFYFTQ